jgi:tRNA threonylcarbamoyl adenosine modification protein YeaZ
MLLLAIDTCLASCSVAVFDAAENRVLAARRVLMERGHAEAAAPMLAEVLAEAHTKIADLARIAVTVGPGSFTGVRIAVSLARGLALGHEAAVIGLDTMQATAAALLGGGKPICVCHRAGTSDLAYMQEFAGNGSASGEITLRPIADMKLPADTLVIGTAAPLIRPDRSQLEQRHDLPDAAVFAQFAATLPIPRLPPEPLYLRAADAKPQPSAARALADLHLQLAGAEAASLLADLHARCFDQAWPAIDVEAMLQIPGTFAVLALTALEPAGFALIRAIAGEAEILTLCVVPHVRQRGVAQKLLQQAAQILRARQVTILHLEVSNANEAALGTYRRAGFVQSGRRKNYYAQSTGASSDAVLMQLKLG